MLLEAFLVRQLYHNITAGRLVVREDRAEPKDGVETLKGLGRFANQRPISPDVIGEMSKQVKLRLRDNLRWFYSRERIKNVVGGNPHIVLIIMSSWGLVKV